MGKPINLSEAEAQQVLGEVFDKQKVILHCGEHLYVGSNIPPPPRGCKSCWEAYYWHMIATTPPHLRRQRVEEALSAVRHGVESYEKGQWDFEPLDRAVIETTHEND